VKFARGSHDREWRVVTHERALRYPRWRVQAKAMDGVPEAAVVRRGGSAFSASFNQRCARR